MGIAVPSINSSELMVNTTVILNNTNTQDVVKTIQNTESNSTTEGPVKKVAIPLDNTSSTSNSASTQSKISGAMESMIPLDELVANPIFATGYAVVIQQSYASS